MDETYIKVKGDWAYLYRAVDKFGDTVDFMLSERRDEAAATAFFKQAIDANGFPNKVVMDKSGANYAGLENINILLMLAGLISFVEILQVKYLNNLIEQDHRFIKKITNPMRGFKAFHAGSRYFCESFYGHPCPTSGKNYATAYAFGGPSRPASLVAYPARGMQHSYAMTRRDFVKPAFSLRYAP